MEDVLATQSAWIGIGPDQGAHHQNTLLRNVGQPRCPNSPGPPALLAPVLAELIRHPTHQFWPDAISLLYPISIDAFRLLEAGQLTDTDL
jgi:hypothetical protein